MPFFGGTYFPGTARYGMASFSDVLRQIATVWETRRADVVQAGEELRTALAQGLPASGGSPESLDPRPDAVPFFGGTYFPGTARYGMASFSDVLKQIATVWETRRADVVEAGEQLRAALAQGLPPSDGDSGSLEPETLEMAVRGLEGAFDATNGGWGGAPKFPQPSIAEFALRRHHTTGDTGLLRMVTSTLDAMMRGGIYDQLGGGFHRYATDEIWLVPHFEKMLYDNAQLARLYLHGYQVTGDESYRRVATETLDYVVREMLDPAGGFYSAQDADSEGEEGRFFVWTLQGVRAALEGSSDDPYGDAELFADAYGITPGGNFEGKSILFVSRTAAEIADERGLPLEEVEARLARTRRVLLGAREQRVKPGLDDKVLAGWNGLMLAAFAEAARVLGRDDYLAVAQRNAEFLWAQMRDERGRMMRTWKNGHAKLNGYLEDYANVADGLLELYQTTFEPRWFAAARELADSILEHFADPRRRLLRHQRRSRDADRATQGSAGRRGPFGRRDGRGGAAAPGGLHRRWPLRRRGARRARADARVDGARASRIRAVAQLARLRALPRPRARDRGRRARSRCSRWRAPVFGRTSWWRAALRSRIRESSCWLAAKRLVAQRPPTCAEDSRASGRSRPRRSWRRCSAGRRSGRRGGGPGQREDRLARFRGTIREGLSIARQNAD